MKLVDILARELKEWPSGCEIIDQDSDRACYADYSDRLVLSATSRADDFADGKVTRAEWQDAVDALYPKLAVSEEWNGEGLPPVGTVCECKFVGQPDSHFTRVTIRYISNKNVVVFGEVETSHNVSGCVFRPIKTPEQIAAEERKKAIEDMVRIIQTADWNSDADMVAAIYDAGYRKFEIVEGE